VSIPNGRVRGRQNRQKVCIFDGVLLLLKMSDCGRRVKAFDSKIEENRIPSALLRCAPMKSFHEGF